MGKVENCQVAVFASLGRSDEFALIDVQLYLPKSWVGADALYGNNHKFLNALEDSGECFMADIHANRKVWLERPTLDSPPPVKGKRGRPATRSKLKSTTNPSLYQRVDKICQDNFEEHSEEVSFRQGSEGAMIGRFYIRTVWLWDETDEGPPRERRLLVREDESGVRWTVIRDATPVSAVPQRFMHLKVSVP